MARTEGYIIMPKNQHYTVSYHGYFIANCDTIHEAEQEITKHTEQNIQEHRKENRTT